MSNALLKSNTVMSVWVPVSKEEIVHAIALFYTDQIFSSSLTLYCVDSLLILHSAVGKQF